MLSAAPNGYEPPQGCPFRRQFLAEMRRLRCKNAAKRHLFLELLGMWLGDGTMGYSNSRRAVLFVQRKERDISFIQRTLSALGIKQWKGSKQPSRDTHGWAIYKPNWFSFFDRYFGDKYKEGATGQGVQQRESPKSAKGALPAFLLLGLTKEESRLVLKGLWRADGQSAGTGANKIYTSSRVYVDNILQLAQNGGYGARFNLSHPKGACSGFTIDGRTYRLREYAELPLEIKAAAKAIVATVDGYAVWFSDAVSGNTLYPAMSSSSIVTRRSCDRDRLWVVEVDHTDHIVLTRRAAVTSIKGRRVVFKASRPVLVGDSVKLMNGSHFGARQLDANTRSEAVGELTIKMAYDNDSNDDDVNVGAYNRYHFRNVVIVDDIPLVNDVLVESDEDIEMDGVSRDQVEAAAEADDARRDSAEAEYVRRVTEANATENGVAVTAETDTYAAAVAAAARAANARISQAVDNGTNDMHDVINRMNNNSNISVNINSSNTNNHGTDSDAIDLTLDSDSSNDYDDENDDDDDAVAAHCFLHSKPNEVHAAGQAQNNSASASAATATSLSAATTAATDVAAAAAAAVGAVSYEDNDDYDILSKPVVKRPRGPIYTYMTAYGVYSNNNPSNVNGSFISKNNSSNNSNNNKNNNI